MTNEIVIMEKPSWITYDDIHELLFIAHASNREEAGFHVMTAEMTGERLEKRIGTDGKTFVALDGERLVGTASYRIIYRRFWCLEASFVERTLIAIHPDYQGKHISPLLLQSVFNDVKAKGYKYLLTETAEANTIVRKICTKEGGRHIDFKAPRSDHYNVEIVQWLDGCPYPKWYTDFGFFYKKLKVKLKYKPGKIERFGWWSKQKRSTQ
ncbi:MAG: GNAT family N-acetyltransferase [Clostridiales bacterium]|nr:GNAT family N-acetyltransferase [Clostridiales bacterium]